MTPVERLEQIHRRALRDQLHGLLFAAAIAAVILIGFIIAGLR